MVPYSIFSVEFLSSGSHFQYQVHSQIQVRERDHHAVKLNHVESTQFILTMNFLSYPVT